MNDAFDLILFVVGLVAAIAGELHVHQHRRARAQRADAREP